MRASIIFVVILLCTPFINAQKDIVGDRISVEKLQEARLKYHDEQKIKNISMLSADVQTILIDIIPSIVKKNRNLRYRWDKSDNKSISVFRHLIHYDSIDLTQPINIKREYIDRTFSLVDVVKGSSKFNNLEYTNLPCLDTFKYNFDFVDNPLQADFLISTFKENYHGNNKLIYVYSRPFIYQTIIYLLEVELPWDNDCYKTKIISTSVSFE